MSNNPPPIFGGRLFGEALFGGESPAATQGTVAHEWHFLTDAEGWAASSSGTGLTSGWTGADTAPSSPGGCLYVRRTGASLTDGHFEFYFMFSPEGIGVPVGCVVRSFRANVWARCATYTDGDPSSYTSGVYVYDYLTGDSVPYWKPDEVTYSAITSWQQHQQTEAYVEWHSDRQLAVVVHAVPRTAAGTAPVVELRIDDVTLELDYVVPASEPAGLPTVTVGRTDISAYVDSNGVTITRESNGRASTARFACIGGVLQDPLSSLLESGASVSIAFGNDVQFAGEITYVSIRTTSRLTRYDVTARDVTARLARAIVPSQSYSSTTVGAIISSIVVNHASGILSSDTTMIHDARSVTTYATSPQTIAQVFEDLAAAYPAAWYVDADSVLHWRPTSQLEPSGRRYYLGDVSVDSLDVSEHMGGLANHVTVRASYDSVTQTDASFTPPLSGDDGILTGSSASWPVGSASSVNTDGSSLYVTGMRDSISPYTCREDRSLVRFDTSSLPDSATVVSSELKLYVNSVTIYSGWNPVTEIRDARGAVWPIDTADWSATDGEIIAFFSSPPTGWNSFAIANGYINKTGYTAFSLRASPSYGAPPAGGYKTVNIRSKDDTNGTPPTLRVTYQSVTPGVYAVAEDSASQSLYGVRKLEIFEPGLTQAECQAKAEALLRERAYPVKHATIETRQGHDLWAGQEVYVDMPPYLAADWYVTTRVTVRYTMRGITTYTIEMIGDAPNLEDYILEALR